MPNLKSTFSVLLGVSLALMASCAPKATVVPEQAPATKREEPKVPEPVVPEPVNPALMEDDGLRIGEINMPKEGDLRATSPLGNRPEGQGAPVISRPPTEPPSRVKPKEEAPKE